MAAEYYRVHNPKAIVKNNLGPRLIQSLKKVNQNLRYVKELNDEIFEQYFRALQTRLREVVKDSKMDIDSKNVSELVKDLEYLNEDPKFLSLVLSFFLQQLEIETDFSNLEETIETSSFNDCKELRHLGYYVAKSCSDILGHDEAVDLWKRMVALHHRDWKNEFEAFMKSPAAANRKEITVRERSEMMVKNWKDYGLADFARIVLDDDKVLFRFDSCLTPETLAEFDDPEWAYLSSCYMTDAPEFNFGPQRLRRTQTLHTASFCDEMYWDPKVHDDPEQPSLEFTAKLGK